MPHKEDATLHITELHRSFAAKVEGVDFTKPIPPDEFEEIHKAITEVNHLLLSRDDMNCLNGSINQLRSTALLSFQRQVLSPISHQHGPCY